MLSKINRQELFSFYHDMFTFLVRFGLMNYKIEGNQIIYDMSYKLFRSEVQMFFGQNNVKKWVDYG